MYRQVKEELEKDDVQGCKNAVGTGVAPDKSNAGAGPNHDGTGTAQHGCASEETKTSATSPKGRLQPIIAATQAVRLTFSQFFVSWSGVLTVVFTGLPPELLQMKAQIDQELPYLQTLKPENPGSKWPKVSLAALRDGKRLSFEQLLKLKRICRDSSKALANERQLLVDKLSVVLFASCSLEETLSISNVPLLLPSSDSTPTDVELRNVEKVMDEFALDRLEQYWFYASKDGNSISHYRNPKLGATLVHFLQDFPQPLRAFRAAVDAELPDMYDWFRESALHVTIRALS
ncbi:hypothetical protein KFL_000850200 [Klebsormidium nitens]|uniref:Uncharacterized protein n=1 Tax=Klebsormidium nitens TaxID=105231 RepID=A0A1Y1HSJ5_KLENI|nr:hypothetical protein KFL_000850200 [Klebsormidium nitens]|eukprot:GAQ81604.1 hypothetical protein KFL_000850200 [Klebsormidium nitens]